MKAKVLVKAVGKASVFVFSIFLFTVLINFCPFKGSQLACTLIGSILRHSHERVVSVLVDSSQSFLGCLVSEISAMLVTLLVLFIEVHLQRSLLCFWY